MTTSSRIQLGVAVAAAVVALAAQRADAGTVSAARSCALKDKAGDTLCTTTVQFLAEPGEVNRIAVAAIADDGAALIADAGAAVTAGAGCVAEDAHRVRCVPTGTGGTDWSTTVAIHAGDGSDTIICEEASTFESRTVASGGPGDDLLQCRHVSYADSAGAVEVNLFTGTGGAEGERDTLVGAQSVTGGPAADVLFGAGGDDELLGGGGHDAIDGGPGNDEIDGGSGSDLLSGADGIDDLSGGEGADTMRGGRGDDYLAGGRGNDWLFGAAGADELTGHSGDDKLIGGSDRDTLDGGAGDDRFSTRDRSRDTIWGGAGRDTASRDRRDRGVLP